MALSIEEKIELEKTRTFMKAYHEINREFSRIFQKLSPGGSAKMMLDRPDKPFEGGISIEARPRGKKISSLELTKFYIRRLKEYDSKLHCVITLTEQSALEEARLADKELATGKYRGPLHGIPYGAKDLLSKKGYKTTWGAMPYKDQILMRTQQS